MNCGICEKELNTGAIASEDCGGDCLSCMAGAGDPEAIEAMRPFPQLRVRTGYSYRSAYGRTGDVLKRLQDLGSGYAAMVDWGTWGHVRWEQDAAKHGVVPGYGMEVPIVVDRDEDLSVDKTAPKPSAWMLAIDTKKFYAAASMAFKTRGLSPSDFGDLEGVLKFAGGAVEILDPSEYDFVDVNPASVLMARTSVLNARASGKPMVITAYNDMPTNDDVDFASAWEVRRSVGMRTLESHEHMWRESLHFVMTREEFDEAVANTRSIAESLAGIKLAKAPIIKVEGDMVGMALEGRTHRLERGHIAEWTQVYEDRLQEEVRQIQMKGFDSYFIVVADLIAYAKQHMLVGPARGSSAGSLVCYLMGITEVDPILHGLLFQRFIDISRSDFPDIDIDFSDTKRYMVFDYLKEKYGDENISKLGNIIKLKGASVIAQVSKKFGVSIDDSAQMKNSLVEYKEGDDRFGHALEDTFLTTEAGREFERRFPEVARCMAGVEVHPSHSGVHAGGIIVCNEPVTHFCTVNEEGIPQLDKVDAEYLNLLKIDALGLRTLGVIEDAGVLTSQQLYDIPLDDPAVLRILKDDKMSGVFQFEGAAVRAVAASVNITSFSNIDHITALARPGPLSAGMPERYAARVNGKEKVAFEIPELEPYLKDTYGVFLYQEQIMNVVRGIGGFDWAKTSVVRKTMAKTKGTEALGKIGVDFIAGAIANGISEKDAEKVWSQMVTFGAYGFNKSHSVAYAIITYWTCYMKHYHRLEFAAASLRGAKDDEQTMSILRELAREGIHYTPVDPDHSLANWTVADGRLIGGILNVKGYGPAKARAYIDKRNAGLLTDKDRQRMADSPVNFADLNEAHTLFGHYYQRPKLCGVTTGDPIQGMREIGGREEGLMICKLVTKTMLDENEPMRIKKRNGKVYPGASQFMDLSCVDDSTDTPFRLRIRPENFERFGRNIAENCPKGSWFLVRGWRLSGIEMFIVKNIKQLEIPK